MFPSPPAARPSLCMMTFCWSISPPSLTFKIQMCSQRTGIEKNTSMKCGKSVQRCGGETGQQNVITHRAYCNYRQMLFHLWSCIVMFQMKKEICHISLWTKKRSGETNGRKIFSNRPSWLHYHRVSRVFRAFPNTSETFRKFSKIFGKSFWELSDIFRRLSKISEDFRQFPKI